MSAKRVNLSQFSTVQRHTPLAVVRMLSYPGQSLFWQPRPQHQPVGLMACAAHTRRHGGALFANRYKGA
jgi:hypothetical protein